MGTPFMAELRLFAYEHDVSGWAGANGQLLPINQNQALFALLGTTYGGNGQTNFALPDLRGRVPIHVGNNHNQGERAGQEVHTVTIGEMPQHLHFLNGNTNNADTDIAGAVGEKGTLGSFNNGYGPATNLVALQPSSVGNVGGSQAHENRQPFLVLTYKIALQGVFPSQN
ncbi:MAG TPA: tail fiber protein [Allosphingosinicella sp.]|jgi:microcystin-dependent protein|nr:tail fiber protein [Allosphingosinicella sp.]